MLSSRVKRLFLVLMCFFTLFLVLGGCTEKEEQPEEEEEEVVCEHTTNKNLFEEVVDGGKQPTCAESGYTLYRCKNCGAEKTEAIAPTGNHFYVNNVCKNCGAIEPPVFKFTSGKGTVSFYYGTGMLNELSTSSDSAYWDEDGMFFSVQIEGSGEVNVPTEDVSVSVTKTNGSSSTTVTKKIRWADMTNNITSVSILGKNITLGDNLFAGGSFITSLTVKGSLVGIGNNTFQDCVSLEKLTLPSGLLSVGEGAFSGCSILEKFSLPNSVTAIGAGLLNGCDKLEELSLPFVGTGDRTGKNALLGSLFAPCSQEDYDQSYYDADSGRTIYYAFPEKFSEIKITGSQDVPAYALANIRERGTDETKLSVFLSSSVETIGDYAFYKNYAMHRFAFFDFSKESCTAEEGANAGCLTAIGKYAFSDCKLLEEFILPAGVKKIEECTFQNCYGLTQFTFLQGDLTSIGNEAFYGCNNVATLLLPEGVTEIGVRAMQGCSGLKTLLLPAEVSSIGSHAFYLCSGLTDVYVSSQWVCNMQSNDTDLFGSDDQYRFWAEESLTVSEVSYLRSKIGKNERYYRPNPDYREVSGGVRYILWKIKN